MTKCSQAGCPSAHIAHPKEVKRPQSFGQTCEQRQCPVLSQTQPSRHLSREGAVHGSVTSKTHCWAVLRAGLGRTVPVVDDEVPAARFPVGAHPTCERCEEATIVRANLHATIMRCFVASTTTDAF